MRWRMGGALGGAEGGNEVAPSVFVGVSFPGLQGGGLGLGVRVGTLARVRAGGRHGETDFRGRFGGMVNVPGGGGRSVKLWS